MRIGFGYDLHRLTAGTFLTLGGLSIPFSKGIEAHSDGDVLLHAIIDALLGASGLRDIGYYFPPDKKEWAGVSSLELLQKTMEFIKNAGFSPVNIDTTIVLEKPKLLNYIPGMVDNLAAELKLASNAVSVKAKTKEGLGEVGEGNAVEAYAVVLLESI